MTDTTITLETIRAAQERLEKLVHKTPLEQPYFQHHQ